MTKGKSKCESSSRADDKHSCKSGSRFKAPQNLFLLHSVQRAIDRLAGPHYFGAVATNELPTKPNSQVDAVVPNSEEGLVTQGSTPSAKIGLFRSLFRGREDVYARRFESRKTGRAGY
jgi:hypothetical protein